MTKTLLYAFAAAMTVASLTGCAWLEGSHAPKDPNTTYQKLSAAPAGGAQAA